MLSMDQIPEEHQTSLDPCWWERHFRGFEAGLPLTLINHTLLFNKPSEGDVTQQQMQIEPDQADLEEINTAYRAFTLDEELDESNRSSVFRSLAHSHRRLTRHKMSELRVDNQDLLT